MQPTENGDSPLSHKVQQALAASAAGDAALAVQLFRLASAEQPTAAIPQFLLGAELAQAGRAAEAEAAFANAVLLAPDFHMARFQLGLCQFTAGSAALGLVTWQALLKLPGDEPLRSFVLGFTELAQDRFEDALDCFSLGMALNTSNAPLNADIGKVMKRIRDQPQLSDPGPAIADDAHVLLSNYHAQGPLN